ncbi:hypothetical protein ACIB24_14780 [Spongisporangium articulatum]|uniref:Small CPxCG-related zinc finger protein n=1 Tax=Spongisporangium articulatum TaxID=3362603 RepID=A0ABW8ART9_9ACTN
MTGSPENRPSATATAQPLSAVGLARIPHQADREISCRHCGTTTSAHIARLSGAWSVVDDRPLWDCDACTRSHLREFETTDR